MSKPKVLVFDIEITINKDVLESLHALGLDERAVLQSMNAGVSHVSCISYQWLGEKKVTNISLRDFPAVYKKDPSNDFYLLEAFLKAFEQADQTVAHYGERFDRRFIITRLQHHGLPGLPPSKLRDTWRILRDNFKLPNNRLDTALKFFKCPFQKPPLDWGAWQRVSKGDPKAFGPMIGRCNADVKGLTWLYVNVLRQYDAQSLNHNLYTDKRVCPKCGSKDVVNDRYLPGSNTSLVLLFRCKNPKCRSYGRLPVSGRGKLR